jgi:hypothetical protein
VPDRRSITPSLWLVTPTAPTRWSLVVLSGSPSPWIAYSSPPPPLPGHCPVLTFVRSALADPNWRGAMEEYKTLLSNSTWDLVSRPPGANVVTSKWIFKHKLKADNSLDRYKARWVLRGFT